MDGLDGGKRADFEQAKSEFFIGFWPFAVDANLHAISKRNEIEG